METNGKGFMGSVPSLPPVPAPSVDRTRQREGHEKFRSEFAISLFSSNKCLRQTLVAEPLQKQDLACQHSISQGGPVGQKTA